MRLLASIDVLIFALGALFAMPYVTAGPLQSNEHLQKRGTEALPSASIPVEYNQGQTNECLKITIPARIWQDAKIAQSDMHLYTLKVFVQTTVDVQSLGFLRNGCSFEDSRDNLNGCKFDGDTRTNLPGQLSEAYLLGVPGVTYHACFDGPPQAASVTTPITFILGYFIKWYDPVEDGD